jgi:hypothetical protein
MSAEQLEVDPIGVRPSFSDQGVLAPTENWHQCQLFAAFFVDSSRGRTLVQRGPGRADAFRSILAPDWHQAIDEVLQVSGYSRAMPEKIWWALQDSNLRPTD